MLRVILTVIVPLLLPSALWFAWASAARRAELRGARWQEAPWPWLAGGGVLLAGAVLYLVSVHFGETGGRYVPSQFIDGELVPGRFER
jgi:Family of unknown function (DUF6111)